MTKQLLMGNEAMAVAALEAGVRVVAGYPGTPSSEIIETIARRRAEGLAHGVHVEWSSNEKVALEVLAGASAAGARCLFTCKQMGLNVAADPLMCLNYVGVKGGMVLVVADDPGPISSQTEQDTRRFASFAKVPVLDPANPEQAYAMVKAAFELSERYGTPVIVRPTTRVDHASAFFEAPAETFAREPIDGGFVRDTERWVIFPKRSYEAHGQINRRLALIADEFSGAAGPSGAKAAEVGAVEAAEASRFACFNPVETQGESPCLGILAGGTSAANAREALRIIASRAQRAGSSVPSYRFMQVGTPYPFPAEAVGRFTEGLERILVLEELDHVLEDELLRLCGRQHGSYDVLGKLTGSARDRGENDVDDFVSRLTDFLGLGVSGERAENPAADLGIYLPLRPPVLCPGCPHRGAFYAVKRALKKVPAVQCGDIGCYTLGNAQPLDALDTCLCMGAGVTMAQGFAVVEPDRKAIAYIGDSTFFASGLPGLANAAYNGHDITVVVLDNATTAMTGSQPHPGTGATLMGEQRTPLSIEEELRANGFSCIERADPLDLEAATEAAKRAIAHPGPSAVLYVSPCIQLVKPDEPVVIDAQSCTGCKKCITEIGCPGIAFDARAEGPRSGKRGQALIDPDLCNGCGLCVSVCPYDSISAGR